MTWDSPITTVKGVGANMATKLAVAFGIVTIRDLFENYPRRYNDFSAVSSIGSLRPGPVTIEASVTQVNGRYVRRGLHITEAIATDGQDNVRLVWFNQPYRAGAIHTGQPYFISGAYELSRSRFAIMNPSMELVSDFPVHTARIVPVYRETKGITSNQLRKIVRSALGLLPELPEESLLPLQIAEEEGLMNRRDALHAIHFPRDAEELAQARRRIGFEEVFLLSLASLVSKYELGQNLSVGIPFDEALARSFVESLPFVLTDDQRKVIWRVYQDIQKTQPMNRLVEGDVGSGKTVVATMAALMAAAAGYQAVFMAPTELLARQHAETIYGLLKPLGQEETVALLVGGMKPAQKKAAKQALADGRARFIVGTHALIQESVDMHNLGLAIIDEQHRFGVEQRRKLVAKAGHMPHLLSLTATPIPRSLALTLYGEMDISLIASKPHGRLPVHTEICSPYSRAQLYDRIEAELARGRQMFVVCPLITVSESQKALSAEAVFTQLSTRDFKHRRIALLHGKIKPAEKQAVMEQFVRGEVDILVSTTVIEVGVDVPNATIMLIEAAEQFGLAQLHQLRGRVGRGSDQGYCYLMMSDAKAPPKRLETLERTNDGFRLAELDLQLRGPGAIYGSQQHGVLDLRIAELTDVRLLAAARGAAERYIEQDEKLVQYPELRARIQALQAVTSLN